MLKKFQQHHQENSKVVADNIRKKLLAGATVRIIKLLNDMPDEELHRATGIEVEVGIY